MDQPARPTHPDTAQTDSQPELVTIRDDDGDKLRVEVRTPVGEHPGALYMLTTRSGVYLTREQTLELYHRLGEHLVATAPMTGDSEDLHTEPLAEWERELRDACNTQTAPTVLEDAQAAVYGDRQQDYGHPREDFTRTAILWTGLLHHKLADGEHLEPADIARCMIAVKLARDVHSPKRDNRVDGAGYFLTLDRLETGL